jgi:fructose-specific phosphotransferase system IIA component
MKISELLSISTIKINMESTTKKEALAELLDVLVSAKKIVDKDEVLNALLEREKLGTTGVGQGIAIPHAKVDSVDNICVALGVSKSGINFNSLDGEPVQIIFLFVAPPKAASEHLKVLAKVSQLLKDRYFRDPLKEATSAKEIIELIKEEE